MNEKNNYLKIVAGGPGSGRHGSVKMKGADVDLEWKKGGDSGDEESVGTATHTVETKDSPDGPSDGHKFSVGDKKYKLGSHESQENDNGTTTHTAEIYEDKN